MTDSMLDELSRARQAFLAEFERVPAEYRGASRASGQWSAVAVVEHLARMDRSVCRLVAHFSAKPLTATAEQLAAAQLGPRLIAATHDRTAKLAAPEPVQPSGTLSEREALDALMQAREALTECYRTADPRVLDGAMYPHPYFGPLTLRAWFELIGHHDARHAGQVAELAAHWRAQASGSPG